MPAYRAPAVLVDGRLLMNKAIRKAGDIDKLAAHLGYQKGTLIYFRAANIVSRFLIKKLQAYLDEGNSK
jgi:hypothetical protein